MGRDDVGCHIVRRMLHRGEGVDILTERENDDTARVLAGGTADTGASLHDPVDLAVPFVLAALFVIVLHVTERCFIRQRTDGSRTGTSDRRRK